MFLLEIGKNQIHQPDIEIWGAALEALVPGMTPFVYTVTFGHKLKLKEKNNYQFKFQIR
ncbi:hypothetical protein pb186bvf_009937 [Paramecium bursaria]